MGRNKRFNPVNPELALPLGGPPPIQKLSAEQEALLEKVNRMKAENQLVPVMVSSMITGRDEFDQEAVLNAAEDLVTALLDRVRDKEIALKKELDDLEKASTSSSLVL